jgi:hypothetical protein
MLTRLDPNLRDARTQKWSWQANGGVARVVVAFIESFVKATIGSGQRSGCRLQAQARIRREIAA